MDLQSGDADAENFNVKVELINEDNSITVIQNELISTLPANSRKKFNVIYQTAATDTQKSFVITIDPDKKVEEYFEDNNFFAKTLYFKNDIVPPDIYITFDDTEVINGDFVSSEPKIKIALSDDSPLPITDTTSPKIYLNKSLFIMAAILQFLLTTNSSNPKFVAEYNPTLSDGEYLLRIAAKDLNGNFSDSASSEIRFIVSSEAKLLYVYNYPNPFADETFFTFKLTQIPDEFKIKIFTVAGRLVKEFSKAPSELNYDFNRIYWDGRDKDGDLIANGVYFYKVIMKKDQKIETTTQKLALVR
ncbi:MAG: T9SS type A sorting domain-containing protein [Ignavibacteriales bacterium]|nr:T9SS type A sorting domain-containing protein [Ignavibacteriales bacterium]